MVFRLREVDLNFRLRVRSEEVEEGSGEEGKMDL